MGSFCLGFPISRDGEDNVEYILLCVNNIRDITYAMYYLGILNLDWGFRQQ